MPKVLSKQERTFQKNLEKTKQAITVMATTFEEQYGIPVTFALNNLCDGDALLLMREDYAARKLSLILSLSFFFPLYNYVLS
jgi:hypothetical protein